MKNNALLLEVTMKEHITYMVPLWVFEMIGQMADRWPALYGRHPKFTIARGLDLIERVHPGTKAQVTVTRTDREDKAIHGVTPDYVLYDELANPTLPYETHR